MTCPSLRLLLLVAHPDDAEFHAGGLAAIYRRRGHRVKMVTLTNGDAGHHQISGPPLAERRRREAAAAAAVIGAEADVWDNPDGRLQPTLDVRWQVIREIRSYRPHLVLTHRTNDYHPDHRAVGDVVRDACYLVTVPSLVPEVPALARDPVVAFLPDRFTKPAPLSGDVVVDVGEQVETIVEMLACHASQFFEWLPFNRGAADQVPEGDVARRRWLRDWYLGYLRPQADRYRSELVARYGDQRGRQIEYAEVFEISEYAAPLDADLRQRLFPE
ncbi:MAG TPA: PIG-L deacetylase family protein [Pirellulales bacterium]|nr:PIG-L deacetylase family protein [Pirellulales bacterium]